MKFVAAILLMFFLSNLALANADTTKQLQKPDKALCFLGKYESVEEQSEYQRYVDSARGVWGGGGAFLPVCTFGAPAEIRVAEFFQFMPEGKMNSGINCVPFHGISGVRRNKNGDTILATVAGRSRKYLIEGKKLLDLNMRLNTDSQVHKKIYYTASKYKYYLKVAD